MPATIPIICDGCQKRILIAREMLDRPLVCSECDTPIEMERYLTLAKARDELLAERAAHEAAKKSEQRERREREQAEREAARRRDNAAREAERLARTVEEQERQRQIDLEEARVKAASDSANAHRESAARASLVIDVGGAILLCVLFCVLGLAAAAFSLYVFGAAKTIMHEIFGALGALLGVALVIGGLLYLQVALMARAVVLKLDAVRDLQLAQIEAMSKLVTIAQQSVRRGVSPQGADIQPPPKIIPPLS